MEKKKKKSWISNIVFIAVLAVIMFTPLGTGLKVWLNRLVAMSPSVERVENQEPALASNWMLQNESGESISFSDFEGKVVIVNYWATWCPPCIAEKPSFQELYNDYKEKVVFIFATTDKVDRVKAFKEKHGYTLPVYYPLNNPPASMDSNVLPSSYVIDKKGNIVVKKFRAADWNSASFRKTLDDLLQ